MPSTSIDLKNRYLAGLLAWLVPGLGHWYQGRRSKAILYSSCILGLFFLGLFLGRFRVVYWVWTSPWSDPENFRLSYLGQIFVGLPALPGLLQAALEHYGLGPVLWGYLAPPTPSEANALHPTLGRLVEVGTVYTIVAGLLNILAIYDALEGPALPNEELAAEAEAASPSAPGLGPLQAGGQA